MKKNYEHLILACIGLGAISVSLLASATSGSRLFSSINDFPLRYIHSNKQLMGVLTRDVPPVKIVAVGIDTYSIEKISSVFPFRRSIYADVVRSLDRAGAKVIAFDLVFKGKSQDPQQDLAFASALKDVANASVVLAYIFNAEGREPFILPEPEFRTHPRCLLGLIDSPSDRDGSSRRLYAYIKTGATEVAPYALSLQMAAAFLDMPVQKLAGIIPLHRTMGGAETKETQFWKLDVSSFLINYLAAPGAYEDLDQPAAAGPGKISRLRFYDVYANLEKLKKQLGPDFFKDSVVLVYPEAEIIHDTVVTPLGKLPGGFQHINGFMEIVSRKFLVERPELTMLIILAACALIFVTLRFAGLLTNAVVSGGAVLAAFWLAVVARLNGVQVSFFAVASSCVIFFIAGSLYKYAMSLVALSRIKNKVTLDPLRDIYTLRYFYYHFDLETRKMYWDKQLYLFFIALESMKAEVQDMPLSSIRGIWHHLRDVLQAKGSFWATYSSEEIVGGLVARPKAVDAFAQALRSNLQAFFQEKGLHVTVKLGYMRWKHEFSVRQALFAISGQMKTCPEGLVRLEEAKLSEAMKSSPGMAHEEHEFLKSIDADIEEKNRELLEVIENLNKEQLKNQEVFFQVILSLVNALEARDPYTQGHSARVTNYALAMAEKLGWNKVEKEKLRKASLLHDLGKIGIPDGILHKKDRLTDDEFDFIKKHEIIAVKILEPIKDIAEILPWILYHHERWDGKGYPHGLGGTAIPTAAQIMSLADVYDALTTGRDYKKAISPEESLAEIEKVKGAQFSPELADIFIRMISENLA